jgi:hypothetical protein
VTDHCPQSTSRHSIFKFGYSTQQFPCVFTYSMSDRYSIPYQPSRSSRRSDASTGGAGSASDGMPSRRLSSGASPLTAENLRNVGTHPARLPSTYSGPINHQQPLTDQRGVAPPGEPSSWGGSTLADPTGSVVGSTYQTSGRPYRAYSSDGTPYHRMQGAAEGTEGAVTDARRYTQNLPRSAPYSPSQQGSVPYSVATHTAPYPVPSLNQHGHPSVPYSDITAPYTPSSGQAGFNLPLLPPCPPDCRCPFCYATKKPKETYGDWSLGGKRRK